MATCANGHDSEWDDFCSSCGIAMSGAAGDQPSASSGAASADPAAADAAPKDTAKSGDGCPNCGEAHADTDVFCENCGYDFLAGSMPGEAPEPDPAIAGPEAALAAAAQSADAPAWKLVVATDRDYFERMSAEGQLDFPDPAPKAVEISLTFEKALIGRRSESRGVFPEIDVLALTGDPAVSTRHAMLDRAADGSYTITDLDSTNGTYLGEATDPVKAGAASPLGSGDTAHVGAWTQLRIESAS